MLCVITCVWIKHAWSNGIYKSIEHGAVTNTKKARFSLAMFVLPDDEAEVGPLETMVRDRPTAYKKIKYNDYIKRFFDRKLESKVTGIIKLNDK